MREVDVAVIGAGPAGAMAALNAALAGAKVALVDEHPMPFAASYPARSEDEALLARLRAAGVDWLGETVVWGFFEGQLALARGDRYGAIRPRRLVLATGAHDRSLAFPGWQLPGVVSLRQARRLAEAGQLRQRRILLAGSSPYLFSCAPQLPATSLLAVIQATDVEQRYTLAPYAAAGASPAKEMRDALQWLRRNRVPVLSQHAVVSAAGDGRVERVSLAELAADGRPKPETIREHAADLLVLDYGAVPEISLARLLGCACHFDPIRDAWYPDANEELATSVDGVWVAGELAGLGGDAAACLSGAVAGLSAARSLGYRSLDGLDMAIEAAQKQLAESREARDAVAEAFAIPAGLWELATDDTVVCPCEGVTAGEVRAAVEPWTASTAAVKRWTRAGMGHCQGRICSAMVAHLVAKESGKPIPEVDHPSVRSPIKPVSMRVLADGGQGGAPLPEH